MIIQSELYLQWCTKLRGFTYTARQYVAFVPEPGKLFDWLRRVDLDTLKFLTFLAYVSLRFSSFSDPKTEELVQILLLVVQTLLDDL